MFGFKKYVEKQTDRKSFASLSDPKIETHYVSLITFAKNKETGKSEKYILSKGPTPAYTFGKLSFRKVSTLPLSREKSNIRFILEKIDSNKFFLKTKPLFKTKPSLYINTQSKLTDTVSTANESFLRPTSENVRSLKFTSGENGSYKLDNFSKKVYIEISKEKIPYAVKSKSKESKTSEESEEKVDESVIEESEPVIEESEEIDEPVIEGFQGFR